MLRSLFGRRKKGPEPRNSPPETTIKHSRVGDVVVIQGLALEYDDAYFVVESVHRYEGNGVTWYELVMADADSRVWLEWSDDGTELFVTASDNRRPVSPQAIGLSEEDLMTMDAQHSIDSSVEIDGRRFFYRNSFEAFYFRANRPDDGEGFYLWEFLSADERMTLGVTKFEGMPFEAHFSQVIPPENVTLYPGERPEKKDQ